MLLIFLRHHTHSEILICIWTSWFSKITKVNTQNLSSVGIRHITTFTNRQCTNGSAVEVCRGFKHTSRILFSCPGNTTEQKVSDFGLLAFSRDDKTQHNFIVWSKLWSATWAGEQSEHSHLQMVILRTAVPEKKCRWFLHCKNQVPDTEERMTDHTPNVITLVVTEMSVSLPLRWRQKWLLWTRTYAALLLVLSGLTMKVLTYNRVTQFRILAAREVCVVTAQLLDAVSVALIFKAKPSPTLAVMSRDGRVGFANLRSWRSKGVPLGLEPARGTLCL